MIQLFRDLLMNWIIPKALMEYNHNYRVWENSFKEVMIWWRKRRRKTKKWRRNLKISFGLSLISDNGLKKTIYHKILICISKVRANSMIHQLHKICWISKNSDFRLQNRLIELKNDEEFKINNSYILPIMFVIELIPIFLH